MGDFNAARALRDVHERREQVALGARVVPVLTAVLAVFAALATLFAHHSSTSGLARKNEGVLLTTKAADQYNYYESKRIKSELNEALIDSDLVKSSSAGHRRLEARVSKENGEARGILVKARRLETESLEVQGSAERFMASYENYEVAATLFEISVVLVSITALTTTRMFLFVAGGASLVGLAFLIVGFLH